MGIIQQDLSSSELVSRLRPANVRGPDFLTQATLRSINTQEN